MKWRPAFEAAALACLLPLLACTPATTPSPTPTPLPSVSPSRPETTLEKEERLAYAEAKNAYRRDVAEMDRLLQSGGGPDVSAELKAIAAGPYLEGDEFVVKDFYSSGDRTTGSATVVSLRGAGYSREELLLDACTDGRGVTTVSRTGKVTQNGSVYRSQLKVRPIEGRWKLWSVTQSEVTSCDDS